ncbi:MAG: hypothetical protein Q7L07_02575, partial [Pseudohongiella sp.]|nr:hypothetical protein [Pseudohongiella sp.]
MKSIESQSDQLYEHILVVSGVIDEGSFRSQYAAPNRVLILNEDKSLYHAMNLGLNVVSGEFVFFLNGGDEFTGSDSLGIILNNCKYNSCLLVRTAQYFGSDCYVRPKLNQLDRMKQFPAHQGFISPSVIAKKYKYIDSKYAIGSDTIWMKAILKV